MRSVPPPALENTERREWLLYRFFRFTLWVKGLFGVGELISALVVMFVPHDWWVRAAVVATRGELIEDPNDSLALWIRHSAESMTSSGQWFVFAYLLLHAVIKIVLVWAVLKNQLWAYPWMIGFLGLFILYQSYEVATTGSLAMVALTVFDVLILLLTWHEWRRHRQRVDAAATV